MRRLVLFSVLVFCILGWVSARPQITGNYTVQNFGPITALGGVATTAFESLAQTLYFNVAYHNFGTLNGAKAVTFAAVNQDNGATNTQTYGIVGANRDLNGTNAKTLAAGVDGEAGYNGSGSASALTLVGTNGVARNDSAFAVGNAAALFASSAQNNGSGSITNVFGVYIQPQSGGVTNSFGIYMNQGMGTFGIYQAGAGPSYFGGPLQLAGLPMAGSSYSALCLNTSTNTVYYNNGVQTCTVSTQRAKEHVRSLTLTDSLDTVLRMRPVTYALKEGGQRHAGFIAEQSPVRSLIARGTDGRVSGFRYEDYTAYLTGALQEQQKQIELLKAEIEDMKQRISR